MGKNKQPTESSVRDPEKREETSVKCFSPFGFGVKEWFWKRQHNPKKCIEKVHEIYTKECVEVESGLFLLPDDILELCLDRLPFEGLKNVRLVCKNWSSFLTTERILQIIIVASINDGIIIVGGKSNIGKVVGPIKEHNEVVFFNAVTKTCKMAMTCKFIGQRKSDRSSTSSKVFKRSFLLIAIGRTVNESLYRGEIYDSSTNEWTDIQSLPLDFGGVSSGTVCKTKFYVCSRNEKLAAYDIERGFWIVIQTSQPFPSHVYANPYHPHLVSCNGRLFVISSCFWNGQHSMVRKLFELHLVDHTWTESRWISIQFRIRFTCTRPNSIEINAHDQ
ncbi:F-box/kelch-repeat plant protein [Medicago truncatula]|uniref:F-box/kelch-repeat plant protein n=1 Tax=Medicago truncatula TaxID=3880 RepID=G7J0T3_MEDTR|nr:F-box/kelch-repeat plant protein [Medicago truncatula]